MKTYLIGIVFILVSCHGQKKAIVKNSEHNSNPDTTLILLLQDEYSGFEVEETMVIKDQKRLNSFYSKLNKTRKPGLPVPLIDFSKEMVIVQCSGQKNYVALPTLSLSSETDSEIILATKTERETKDAPINVITNPFCIYKMPLSVKEIVIKNELK